LGTSLHVEHTHLKLLAKKMKNEKPNGMPRIPVPLRGAIEFNNKDEPKR
jgi:hypothetical protein